MKYKRIEIDLSTARNEEELNLEDYFSSVLFVKYDADFQYKINSKTSDNLFVSELQGFEKSGAIHSLYLTNEAAEGKKAILVVIQ